MDQRWQEKLDHYNGIIGDWNNRFPTNPINPDAILDDYIPKHVREGKANAPNWYEKNRQGNTVLQDNVKVDTQVLSGTVKLGSPYNKNGLDIAAPKGTPILSPTRIKITKVVNKYNKGFPNNKAEGKKQNGGWGNQVVGRLPNGKMITFNHLSNVNVKAGDTIEVGDEIGGVGNTGLTIGTTGNHLDISMFDENGEQLSLQDVWDFIQFNSSTTALK